MWLRFICSLKCFKSRKLTYRLRVIISAENSLKLLFFNHFWVHFLIFCELMNCQIFRITCNRD